MKKRLLAILLIVSLLMTMTILPAVPAMAAMPTVTSLSPNTGAPGQTLTGVVITGTNFTGATALNFSGVGVTSGALVVVSDTTITTDIVIAGNAALGPRDVTVTTAGGASDPLNAGFTVQIPGTLGSKVNSLLSLHIKLKTDYLAQPGHLPEDRIPLPGIDDPEFASLTDAGREGIFIRFNQPPTPAQLSDLNSLGVTTDPNSWVPPVGNHPTGYILADMPVDKLDILAARDYVAGLDTSEVMAYPENDLARAAMGVQPVWDGGDTGAGVRIAVLDSGLDIQNADGTPNNNPEFPTNFAAADYSNSTANTPITDPVVNNTITGHGTHVTGSVLGQGVNSNGKYKGVAPDADLVFLKIGSDATSSASYPAMKYAIDAAVHDYQSQIITMSYGGFSVYHDGSDEICQAVDAAVDDGTTVFVSAGNSAENKWHYSGTLAAGATSGDIPITNASSNNPSHLQIGLVWFDGPDHNGLSLQYYSGNTLLTSTGGGQSESTRGTESNQYWLNSPVGPGTYKLRVKNNSSHSQFFHIYYNGGSTAVTFSGTSANLGADPNYTICSPAEADSAIAVGAYVTRKSWQDYIGTGWTYTTATLNSISTFSSLGPRVDIGAPGKPDIVAPGQGIISVRDKTVYPWPAYNTNAIPYPYNNYIIDNDGLNGTGPADYFLMSGTSMACPLAAGVGALLLSNNPSLTPAEVRHCLEITATDMGAIGFDTTYGWGRINASSVNNNWSQIKKLTASDGAEYDIFGYSTSISGDTLVVGAAYDTYNGPYSGSVYVFERNQGVADNWGQVAKLTASDGTENDSFGYTVSISGDTIVVGAYLDTENGTISGSAYVFKRSQVDPNNWDQVKKLTASDGLAGKIFGYSVSVSGDIIVVGAAADNVNGTNSGSAYVFKRNEGGVDMWGQVAKLTASDGAADDHFGWSVSVSGETIVIGGEFSGSAYVFEPYLGGEWEQVKELIPAGGSEGDMFGAAVSISGDSIVVGSPWDFTSGPNSGSAYVFKRNQDGPNVWGQVAKLTASDGASLKLFGQSVSISGGTIIAGAYGDNENGTVAGSAYVFSRNQNGAENWGQVKKLIASDGLAYDDFGYAVSISGCTIVAGAFGRDDNGILSGAAYVFHRICCQEPPLVKVTTATNVGVASFSVDHGTIDDLTAFAEATIPTDGKPPSVNFPFGFFSIRITNLTHGQTVIVTIHLPATVPPVSEYWKYHASHNAPWFKVLPGDFLWSGGVITLKLTDGGSYDADGEANGTIVDPGAPTVLSMPDLVVSAASAVQVSGNPSQYNVVYTITNTGDADAGPSTTSIVIDGGTPLTTACPALNAGDSDAQSTSIQTISGASDSIVITADSADAVTEGNEDNNSTNLIYSFRQYHLVTGWNTFSTPISLASGNNTLGTVLTGASYDLAYGFNAQTQSWVSLTGTSQIQPCDAIYIHMLADYTATLVVNTALTSPPSKNLTAGWNLIGLANLQAMKANEALLSINVVAGGSPGYSQVLSQALNNQTGWTYVKGQPVSATGPIAWLQPGKGYWVFMISSGTLAGFTTTPLP